MKVMIKMAKNIFEIIKNVQYTKTYDWVKARTVLTPTYSLSLHCFLSPFFLVLREFTQDRLIAHALKKLPAFTSSFILVVLMLQYLPVENMNSYILS